jgi:uncharacterized repeat protein (TIGR04076 family)
MAKQYNVRITLVSQLKKCPNGHKVGDTWLIKRKTPEGMCLGAFNSLIPFITLMRFGGGVPTGKGGRGDILLCCPDPKVVNVFKLERIKSEK